LQVGGRQKAAIEPLKGIGRLWVVLRRQPLNRGVINTQGVCKPGKQFVVDAAALLKAGDPSGTLAGVTVASQEGQPFES